jgi:hypothetical protein
MTDKVPPVWQKKFLGILCVIMIIAILGATLWPFDFFRPNGVSWLPQGNGIRFAGAGVILGNAPMRAGGTRSDNSCSLEILLRPTGTESLRTILSIYVPVNPKQLLIRQFAGNLLVSHDFLDSRRRVRTAKLDADQVFQPGKLLLLTMTSGPNGTVIYTNGSQRQVLSSFMILPGDFAGQIIVGNSPTRYGPWQGEVYALAIYSKELTPAEVLRHYTGQTDKRHGDLADLTGVVARYDFTEGTGRMIHNAVPSGPDLEIPERFDVPHKPFLQSPAKHFEANWYYVHDVLLNVMGFIPLGFILCTYWGRTRNRQEAILYAILAGAALSLVIEVLQAYVPQRDSGVTDIITNSLGAGLGAVLAGPGRLWTLFGRAKSMHAQ